MPTGFSPSSPYYSPYRATPGAIGYPGYARNTVNNAGYMRYPGYSGYSAGGGYPAQHRLSLLKQQLAGTVINASREPVTLSQLTGKRDGEPVNAKPFVNAHYTGLSTVDGAVQRAGGVMGYVPQALSNVASTSVKGAAIGGVGATGLAGLTIVGGKLLGKLKGWGVISLTLIALGAGLAGSLIGGLAGAAKGGFDALRDLKDIVLGNR